jgi:hypothetical protein
VCNCIPAVTTRARSHLAPRKCARWHIVDAGVVRTAAGRHSLRTRVRFSMSEQRLQDYTSEGLACLVASSAVYTATLPSPTGISSRWRSTMTGLATNPPPSSAGDQIMIWLGGGECNCSVHPARAARRMCVSST